MVSLSKISDVLDHPRVYLFWQSPYIKSKLRPLFRHNDVSNAKRVLDVGCGPGTNTPFFKHTEYLGLDLNENYINFAKRTYPGRFILTDVRTYEPPEGERYDLVLLNSFLHHIDDENTLRILRQMRSVISDGGHIHILDLLMPPDRSIARWLAKKDRGDFPRPLDRWHELFSEVFEPVEFEPFSLSGMGVDLWKMVYFKGRVRQA